MRGWTTVRCSNCGGCGLVSVYTMGGTDFDGAGECPQCNGGHLWLHTASGRLAQYPGGPFAGRLTHAETREAADARRASRRPRSRRAMGATG